MKVETLEKNLERIDAWIRSADQKISIFLAFEAGLFAVVIWSSLKWFAKHLFTLRMEVVITLVIALLLFAYSILKLIFALSPRLKKDKYTGKSFLFFGDIAKQNFSEFRKSVSKKDEKQYSEDLLQQIHINSKIANTKHVLFSDAISLFLSSICIVVVALILAVWRIYG